MSLQGAARDWFIYQHQPFGNWQEMQQRFLNKFFPAIKVASIRRAITVIAQFQEEGLDEYWKRFNMLYLSCPNHQISEALLLVYFYEGLLFEERMFVDVAAGGSLLDRTPTEARKLICKLAELKEIKNVEYTKAVIWEEESAERLGKISSLVPHTQQLPVEGEMLLQQRVGKEEGKEAMETLLERVGEHRRLKPISHFFTLLFYCSDRFLLIACIVIGSIVNSRIKNMLFFIST
ncbi:uncharacterized protein LOC108327050 isoform X1 [Vigna angularis]|uniref:uncharacterized protein LOC108327050 isoform X1 n=1 Tax=Phaseolus angularis TaxID=3914 RepID=UPI00080A50DB|nr:uncharacterized protein LOC108327050 isoform X1 [Vigna angularis]